jgi:hypothetical protein
MVRHLVRQLDARIECIGRAVPLARVGRVAEQAFEVGEQRRAEAAAEGVAGQGEQLSQLSNSHRREPRHGVAPRQSRLTQLHPPERMPQMLRIRQRHAVVARCEQARAQRRRREREAVGDAERVEVGAQLRLEARPRPEQAEARLDLEQQRRRFRPASVLALERHQRAVAVGPRGEQAQQRGVARGLVLDGGQFGHQRLRGEQALARVQAGGAGGVVAVVQHPFLARARHQRERVYRIRDATK